jgi:hypothetical protein
MSSKQIKVTAIKKKTQAQMLKDVEVGDILQYPTKKRRSWTWSIRF